MQPHPRNSLEVRRQCHRDLITRMVPRTGTEAFTACVDTSSMASQDNSPLFSAVPSEIRNHIFEFALTSSDDLDKPYAADRIYYRPGYTYHQKVDISLLLTCKRVFHETRIMPVSQVEHVFWLFGGPLGSLRTRHHAVGNFGEWQKSLNEDQQAAVQHVHLFVQQYYLEHMGVTPGISELKFKTRVLTITFRYSDWWSWQSPAESTDRLGICPWLPARVSHQAMLAQPVSIPVQDLKATMTRGTWGWQIGQIKGLEVLKIEFETDSVKKQQLKIALGRARYWRFPLSDSDAVLEQVGEVREWEWTGQANLKQDSGPPMLRQRAAVRGRDAAIPLRRYIVAQMMWKKRSGLVEEA